MPDSLLADLVLFAAKEAAPAAGGAAAGADQGSPLSMLPIIAIIFFLFYLLILRPQQQQERKRRELVNALKKNDRVLTAAGIYGTVVSVDGEQVVLRVSDEPNVKLTFQKSTIYRLVDQAADKEKKAEAVERTGA